MRGDRRRQYAKLAAIRGEPYLGDLAIAMSVDVSEMVAAFRAVGEALGQFTLEAGEWIMEEARRRRPPWVHTVSNAPEYVTVDEIKDGLGEIIDGEYVEVVDRPLLEGRRFTDVIVDELPE